MNEQKLQVEIAEEENPSNTADFTDDDLAASLGYITTLTEQSMPREEMTEMEDEEEGDMKDLGGADTSGTPDKDNQQDERIAQIEAELQKLLAEENDTETENTGTEA